MQLWLILLDLWLWLTKVDIQVREDMLGPDVQSQLGRFRVRVCQIEVRLEEAILRAFRGDLSHGCLCRHFTDRRVPFYRKHLFAACFRV